MEISWYGHACFRLRDRGATLVTDPYDKSLGLPLPRLKADIVTVSHPSPHHNYVEGVKDVVRVIDGPGEYELKEVFITGIRLTSPRKNGQEDGAPYQNNVFVVYMEDIAICHLGDLNHIPTQQQVEDLGSIDVLMIPVGGNQALNAAQAAEVISLIEPYIVIPMHYSLPELAIQLDPVSKFLKEMGVANTEAINTLKLTKTTLPEETQIILLEPKS
jgi:L-ascorbate metabolism protein UlaG (beta-lactamase superfamily)